MDHLLYMGATNPELSKKAQPKRRLIFAARVMKRKTSEMMFVPA
jgi:hypothetical protein